jgi:hypothetical protein
VRALVTWALLGLAGCGVAVDVPPLPEPTAPDAGEVDAGPCEAEFRVLAPRTTLELSCRDDGDDAPRLVVDASVTIPPEGMPTSFQVFATLVVAGEPRTAVWSTPATVEGTPGPIVAEPGVESPALTTALRPETATQLNAELCQGECAGCAETGLCRPDVAIELAVVLEREDGCPGEFVATYPVQRAVCP